MSERSEDLQSFVDATVAAFNEFARDPKSRHCIHQISAGLEHPGAGRQEPGSRLPACDYLDAALSVETSQPSLQRLIGQFKRIEPQLKWSRRPTFDGTASENFFSGHANAMIVGPGGLEERNDLWLGATIMAPNVRYPDHDHAPEEVYLVLSQGEFMQGYGNWFSPGIGGSFYNVPNIRHAMRSADTPLFAFWALLAEQAH